MHRIYEAAAAVLLLLFFVSSTHAFEHELAGSGGPQALLSYGPGLADGQSADKRSESVSLRIFPGTEGHERALTGKQGATFNNDAPVYDAPLRSYIVFRHTPQSIVNDITMDFSTRKDARPFNMDLPSNMNEAMVIGSAFMTNLMMHEFGHTIIADQLGASGNRVNFFKQKNGSFFLGTSTVSHIKSESRLPYVMGGEFFADITFEHALREYRKSPSLYNRSLLLFSGTDFLSYCLYAFSMDSDNTAYDPVSISRETGISEGALISIAIAKTALNAYRVYSGEDRVVPYFTVDEHSAALNLGIPF